MNAVIFDIQEATFDRFRVMRAKIPVPAASFLADYFSHTELSVLVSLLCELCDEAEKQGFENETCIKTSISGSGKPAFAGVF